MISPNGWIDRGCTEKYPFVCFDGKEQHMIDILSTGNVVLLKHSRMWYDSTPSVLIKLIW